MNARLDMLVLEAFEIPASLAHVHVRGGVPSRVSCTRNCSSRDEILSARFDIQATIPDDLPPAQRALALRAFLEERFKLQARLEAEDRPTYALTVAREGRLGPRLRRSSYNCGELWATARKEAVVRGTPVVPPTDAVGKPLCAGGGNMSRIAEFVYVRKGAAEITALVNSISGDLPLPLIDRTGLVGNFEWELTSAMPGFSGPQSPGNAAAPALEDALDEQLGLRPVRSTSPVQMLVIESVSMPTPN